MAVGFRRVCTWGAQYAAGMPRVVGNAALTRLRSVCTWQHAADMSWAVGNAALTRLRSVCTWQHAADMSWAVGKATLKGIGAIASKAFAPFATVAAWCAAPVIYTWPPVHAVVNKVGAPLAEQAAQTAGFSVPQPLQMLGSFLAYEQAKKRCFSAEMDFKKATVFSAVALYASQDPTVQRIARSAMTPTVLGTIAACAALDYANTVAKEKRWIPPFISERVRETGAKIKAVGSMVLPGPAPKAAEA